MKISQILKGKSPIISFEFFPPKKVENEGKLFDTVDVLKKFSPDFVSITYGAGGSTTDKTIEWSIKMKNSYGLNVMMHLTCISSTKQQIDSIIGILKKEKIDNILALRGDIPKEKPIKSDFKYAYQLVEYLKEKGDFSIGVAGYPEGHPEAESLKKDTEYLKTKIDAGGEFIITQLFFDNSVFFSFLERIRKAGIDVPVIAGIMPIVNISQVERFVNMCGATVPEQLLESLKGKSKEEMYKIGVEYATRQCAELLKEGVNGLHFYTLNKYNATEEILSNLKGEGLI